MGSLCHACTTFLSAKPAIKVLVSLIIPTPLPRIPLFQRLTLQYLGSNAQCCADNRTESLLFLSNIMGDIHEVIVLHFSQFLNSLKVVRYSLSKLEVLGIDDHQ